MGKTLVFLGLLFPLLASSGAHAQVAKETPLMTKGLPDVPGREGLIETVLAPGEIVPAHRPQVTLALMPYNLPAKLAFMYLVPNST